MHTVDPGYSTSRTTSRIVGTELFRSPTTYGISRTLEAWYVRTAMGSPYNRGPYNIKYCEL